MRRMLIVLTLAMAVLVGCGVPSLLTGGLTDIFGQLGGCDVYDSNNDGVVTADEVRDLFNQVGVPADAFSDAELLEAIQQLGCTTG